jgi:hypothetical protein
MDLGDFVLCFGGGDNNELCCATVGKKRPRVFLFLLGAKPDSRVCYDLRMEEHAANFAR